MNATIRLTFFILLFGNIANAQLDWEILVPQNPPADDNISCVAYDGYLWILDGSKGDGLGSWRSRNGSHWEYRKLPHPFPPGDNPDERNHTSVVFDDQILILNYRGVFSTTDGINWGGITGSSYNGTDYQTSLIFENKIWLLGGDYTNDIRCSTNGVDWTHISDGPSISHHSSVVFDNKMWMLGGTRGLSGFNVYNSTNGVNWNELSPGISPGYREDHASFVYDNKMWVIGGHSYDYYNYYSDVWYSEDGLTWTITNASAPFGCRAFSGSTVYDGKMWIICGSGYPCGHDTYSDAWFSTDGVNWYNASPKKVLPAGTYVPFQNNIWSIGPSDIQYTSNGIDWFLAEDDLELYGRFGYSCASIANKLYLVGGKQSPSTYHNDIWRSLDGIHWTREVENAPFSKRFGHALVEFQNKLWVIGGTDGTNSLNDVWCSEDGYEWTQVLEHAPFSPRNYFQYTVYKDKLWIIGHIGTTSQDKRNDVWYTSDGINWTEAPAPPFSYRYNMGVASKNGLLWVISGQLSNYYDLNEFWFTEDGYTWHQAETPDGFSYRHNPKIVNFQNDIWIFGGIANNSFQGTKLNDVWRSIGPNASTSSWNAYE